MIYFLVQFTPASGLDAWLRTIANEARLLTGYHIWRIQMKDKIIFLDFDGVLNCNADFDPIVKSYDPVHSKLHSSKRWQIINAVLLHNLAGLVRETGAKIVLSTSWRLELSIPEVHKLFKRYKRIWPFEENRIVGMTHDFIDRGPYSTNLSGVRLRVAEIEAYIQEHKVENYVILDDLALYMNNHVWTNEYEGLTELKANEAKTLLGRLPKYGIKINPMLNCFI